MRDNREQASKPGEIRRLVHDVQARMREKQPRHEPGPTKDAPQPDPVYPLDSAIEHVALATGVGRHKHRLLGERLYKLEAAELALKELREHEGRHPNLILLWHSVQVEPATSEAAEHTAPASDDGLCDGQASASAVPPAGEPLSVSTPRATPET